MLTNLIHVQYCYQYLLDQIPVSLLLYSHIPTALIAVLFGGYLLSKSRQMPSVSLFIVSIAFACWSIFDLMSWFAYLGSDTTMFSWSLVDMFGLVFFFFSYYFIYTFIKKKDLPTWQKIASILLILPTIIWTFFGSNLPYYDANTCAAIENGHVTNYLFIAEAIFIIAVITFIITARRKTEDKIERKKIALAGWGIGTFLVFFFSSSLLVNFLVSDSVSLYVYNYEIYGLFGMPILLGFLTYLVVRYNAFNVKLIGAQALVLALLVLIGSQFFFIKGTSAAILNGVTFVIAITFGHFLVRGVKKEIDQKNKLAELSHKLEESNEKLKALDKLKTEFVSLVSHQLRSPLTAIKGYASMLIEGSFGKMADEQDTAVKRVYTSAQGLSNMVEDFLNISKIEQGGMKFEFMPVELSKVVKTLVDEMKIPAQSKGLELRVNIPAEEFNVTADPTKIKQVFLNLVDNSIKYTQKGFVEVGLQKEGTNVLFYVKDSGMGFDQETRTKLFQKFARGTDGGKVNTGGSGLGLYLAQQIARAHKGDVDAISEGPGKGAIFKVLIPMAK